MCCVDANALLIKCDFFFFLSPFLIVPNNSLFPQSSGESHPSWVFGCSIDIDDIEFIMSDLWSNRCAITGERLGNMLELYKWVPTEVACAENLVLMSARGRKTFLKAGGKDGLEKKIVEFVEGRLEYARTITTNQM